MLGALPQQASSMHGTLSGAPATSSSVLPPPSPPPPRTAHFQLPNFATRASFELKDDDVALLGRYRGSTGSLHAVDSLPALALEDPVYQAWLVEHPCVLTHFDSFLEQLKDKRLAVFLDYDGTLTPIVNCPEAAFMSDQMRAAVKAVAQRFPTAIISGRGRDKVENFVQLPELFYAGSHGMDIAGPKCCSTGRLDDAFSHQPAAEFRPLMDHVFNELTKSLSTIRGATVEHNNFCVSAHFRNCSVDSWQAVVSAVDDAVSTDARLRVTRGRKVLEVRPEIDWDKGRALTHLLEVLGLANSPDVVALYIGDDKTDEDAFQLLQARARGIGILVSTKAKQTAAAYTVRDPAQVQAFLVRLVSQYGGGASDGWVRQPHSCNGWAPAAAPVAEASAAAAAAVVDAAAVAAAVEWGQGDAAARDAAAAGVSGLQLGPAEGPHAAAGTAGVVAPASSDAAGTASLSGGHGLVPSTAAGSAAVRGDGSVVNSPGTSEGAGAKSGGTGDHLATVDSSMQSQQNAASSQGQQQQQLSQQQHQQQRHVGSSGRGGT